MLGNSGLSCVVAFDDMPDLSPSTVARGVRAAAPRSAIAVERRPAGRGEQVLVTVVDGVRFGVLGFAGSLDPEAFRGASSAGAAAMGLARASAVILPIAPIGGGDAHRAAAAALTKLAAAIAGAGPARAAFWQGSGSVVPPARLSRAALALRKGDDPLDLWIGGRWLRGRDEAGNPAIGAATRGAAPFIGAEIEIAPSSERPAEELRADVMAAVAVILAAPHPLADGETLALRRPAHQRYAVSQGGSRGRATLTPIPVETARREAT